MYFYLSIGTNIKPEKNAVRIISNLCRHFGTLTLLPFVYTKPETIPSTSIFLNSLVVIESKLNSQEIKSILNAIEIKLGRNHNDPFKSTKDRPADIDILLESEEYNLSMFETFTESYIQACLPPTTPADLSMYNLPSYQGAASVNFDDTTSKIQILYDELDCLVNR